MNIYILNKRLPFYLSFYYFCKKIQDVNVPFCQDHYESIIMQVFEREECNYSDVIECVHFSYLDGKTLKFNIPL